MPISANQAKQLRTLITKRVNAEVAASWKGAQPPEDRAQIDEDLDKASQRLEEYINLLRVPT